MNANESGVIGNGDVVQRLDDDGAKPTKRPSKRLISSPLRRARDPAYLLGNGETGLLYGKGMKVGYEGSEFYDTGSVFETYLRRRQRIDNPNDTLEKPIMLELLGSVEGSHVLDLGCGDAAIGQDLLAQGAVSYLGLDGSHKMVEQATNKLAGTAGQVEHADIRTWKYPANSFDGVIARLVLHYVEDVDTLFAQVYATLRPGGLFVFSVEHPVITSCDRAWQAGGVRQDWVVDDYFDSGRRVTQWMGEQVVKYHRTVEEYFGGVQAAGFSVERLRESKPERSRIADELTYLRRRRIPLFLCLAARRPLR